MVWETPTCFQTGSAYDIETCIGQGFAGIFGNPIFLTAFLMIMGAIICFKFKVSWDLTAIFEFSLAFIASYSIGMDWLAYVLLIPLAIASGYGVYKFLRR